MRIKLLRNLGADFPSLKEREVVEVDDKLGELLCERHLAEALPAVIHAIPAAPLRAIPERIEKATADVVEHRAKPGPKRKPRTSE